MLTILRYCNLQTNNLNPRYKTCKKNRKKICITKNIKVIISCQHIIKYLNIRKETSNKFVLFDSLPRGKFQIKQVMNRFDTYRNRGWQKSISQKLLYLRKVNQCMYMVYRTPFNKNMRNERVRKTYPRSGKGLIWLHRYKNSRV